MSETMSRELWLRPAAAMVSPSLHPISLLPPSLTRPQGTAGQERFSSLSSAVLHHDGADAVILILDVNQPETLGALNRWRSEFCACGPLSDEEMEQNPLVVVGSKTDLAPSSTGPVQSLLSQIPRRCCVGLHRQTRPAIRIPIQ
jgi:hypothetical protein